MFSRQKWQNIFSRSVNELHSLGIKLQFVINIYQYHMFTLLFNTLELSASM
eukprot:14357.XXX_131227_131379_1 [CDS] Oithona nana genome sequencing.